SDGHTMHIRVGDCRTVDGLPGLATVGTAAQPIDFNAHPDVVAIHRVNGKARDARDANVGAFISDGGRLLLPAFATVCRAEDLRGTGRASPRKENLWVEGINRYGPDRVWVQRRIHLLPGCPCVITAIQAFIGAGVDNFWPPRVVRQHAHHGIRMHALINPNALPGLPTVVTPHNSLPNSAD